MFQSLFVCCAFEATFLPLKLHCHVHINVCTYVHAHLCNLNVWLMMWVCSRKVEAVLLAASVSFLSPVMLNPSSNRSKTSTYKAIIQFWRHSIANQGKSNIDKNTCKASNVVLQPSSQH